MVTSVGQDTVTGLATRAPDRRSTESQSRFLLVGEIHAAVLYLPVAEGAQGFYVGHPVNSEPHSWEMVLCSWWWLVVVDSDLWAKVCCGGFVFCGGNRGGFAAPDFML